MPAVEISKILKRYIKKMVTQNRGTTQHRKTGDPDIDTCPQSPKNTGTSRSMTSKSIFMTMLVFDKQIIKQRIRYEFKALTDLLEAKFEAKMRYEYKTRIAAASQTLTHFYDSKPKRR